MFHKSKLINLGGPIYIKFTETDVWNSTNTNYYIPYYSNEYKLEQLSQHLGMCLNKNHFNLDLDHPLTEAEVDQAVLTSSNPDLNIKLNGFMQLPQDSNPDNLEEILYKGGIRKLMYDSNGNNKEDGQGFMHGILDQGERY